MALNDRLKGHYYLDYTNKLSSKVEVNNQITTLQNFYTTLIELINTTYNNIDTDRLSMVSYLNRINTKLKHIRYMLNNFDKQIDDQLEEKLHSIMEDFSTQFTDIIDSYSLNVFNHKTLSDSKEAVSDTDPTQSYDEYNRSINQLQTSMNINWYGGKLNDKNILNKLNNVLRIVKHNTTEGKLNEDYINSNLILELFLFGPKGMTWLELGQNSTFGYNMIVKYQSNKNNFNATILSENMYNPREYDINKFDLNLLLNLCLDSTSATGSDVYVKIKTNIPAYEYSGKDGYFLHSDANSYNYEPSKKIDNIQSNSVSNDNPDVEYVFKSDKTLVEQYTETQNFVKIASDYTLNLTHDYKYNLLDEDLHKNDQYHTFTKIYTTTGSNLPLFNVKQVKGTEYETFDGSFDIINGIVLNPDDSVSYSDSTKYFDGLSLQNSKYAASYNPKYIKKEQIVDMMDYRNIGTASLINKNELMFAIDNSIEKPITVINNNEQYGAFKDDTEIVNKTYNNGILDILSNNDFSQTIHESIGTMSGSEVHCVLETSNGGVLISTDQGILTWNDSSTQIENTSASSGSYGKIIELNNGDIYVMSLDNNGIYKYTGVSQESGLKTFTKTNIITGTFSDAIVSYDGSTFYAIANTGSIDYDSTNSVYNINNMLFTCKNGVIYEYSDIIADDYDGDSSVKQISSTLTTKFRNGSNNVYKIVYSKKTKRYYVLNQNTGYLFESNINTFGFFVKAEVAINVSTTDVVHDLLVDEDGNILFSKSNGLPWTQSNITGNYYNYTQYFSDKNIFITGNYSSSNSNLGGVGIYYSLDGKTWTRSNIIYGYYKNYIQYFKNKDIFITGCDNVGFYKGLLYSLDGKTWTQSNITTGHYLNCTQYFADKQIFIAGNNSDTGLYYSLDGKIWTQSNITTGNYYNYTQYFKDKDIFIISNYNSSDGLLYSLDGITWTQSNITTGGYRNYTQYFKDKDIFITGCDNVGFYKGLLYSLDGKTWTRSNITTGYYYNYTQYFKDKDIFITGCDNDTGILYSLDGKTWTRSNITTGYYKNYIQYFKDKDIFITGTSGDGLLYSLDGKTWTRSNITTGSYQNYTQYFKDKDIFITGTSSDGLLYSLDGKTWTQSNITTGFYYNYTQYFKDKDIFITGNDDDTGILYSLDGKTWTRSNITTESYRNYTQYFKDKDIFITSNYNRSKGLLYSLDGITWTQSNITTGGYRNYTQYFKDKDIFITGNDSHTGIYYSLDGITWTNLKLLTYKIGSSNATYRYSSDTIGEQITTLMKFPKNGKDYYTPNFQLSTLNSLSEQTTDTTTPVTPGIMKFVNNNLFILPRAPSTDEISDIVYQNGYYYILINNGKVYKLGDSLDVVGSLQIDPTAMLVFSNILGLLKNSKIYTDNETIQNYPALYKNDSVKKGTISYETRIVSKANDE